MLDHADDKQAAGAIRLLLFTGGRSEITDLRWIRGTRAMLPDSKTGPKAIQLSPPARAVLNALPRNGPFVFPNRKGGGPMTDLGLRWQKLRDLAGLDGVRIHDCRHRFASHAVMSGLDLWGAALGKVINLKWDEIGELGEDGASVRLEDSKTGLRTIWLGPEAARLVAALPRSDGSTRVFPEDLTSARLYMFWVGIREEAGLSGLRIHDGRHTWASQGVMNGVGLTTVGRLLGHRQRETTAIYAHLDDGGLRDAAARAAAVIARAMGYSAELPPLRDETDDSDTVAVMPEFSRPRETVAPGDIRTPLWLRSRDTKRSDETGSKGGAGHPPRRPAVDWL